MPDPTRVSINYCATVLGLSHWEAARLLRKTAFAYPRGADGLYDARALDLLRAMRGLPHRALKPVHKDWLAHYLKETHAPQGTQGPEPPDA